MKLGRFEILETLFDSDVTKVLRVRDEQGRRLILKILRQEDEQIWYRMRHENEIGKHLNGTRSLRTYGMVKVDGKHALVLEDFGAISLRKMMNGEPVSMNRFFGIAMQLSAALDELHEQGIIHLDITPANILIDPETLALKISDFGLAEYADRLPTSPQAFMGTYTYMAPEQFGRLNRVVDARSDLYALGVICYELLTGKQPFRGRDMLEVFHAHMTAHPGDIRVLNPIVPLQVENLLLRLLAKDPDRRYHSAKEIYEDLKKCRRYWEDMGAVPEFPLSQPMRLVLPQSLFGRGDVIQDISKKVDALGTDNEHTILIKGSEGIGKSYLLQELTSRFSYGPHMVVRVELDEEDQPKSYRTLQLLIHKYVELMVVQPDAVKERFAAEILRRLGPNLALIVDNMPVFAEFFPQIQPIEEAIPVVTSRFKYALLELVQTMLASEMGSLIITIDGLEWVDRDSQVIMNEACEYTAGRRVMLVGVCDGEEPDWYTAAAVYELTPITRPEAQQYLKLLGPLNPEDVSWLAEHTLRRSLGRHEHFVGLIRKAIRRSVLQYDAIMGEYRVDRDKMGRIEDPNVSDQLLLDQIHQLTESQLELVQIAAVIGTTFELDLLESMMTSPASVIRSDVLEILRQGIFLSDHMTRLYISDVGFDGSLMLRFANKKLRDRVKSMMDQTRIKQLHYMAGLLMMERQEQLSADEVLVDHLNAAGDLLAMDIYTDLLRMNHIVARRMLEWNRWDDSLHYYEMGMRLLTEQSAFSTHELFYFQLGFAECLYINRKTNKSLEMFDRLIKNAADPLDAARVHRSKMVLYIHDGHMQEAYDEAELAFRTLGDTLDKGATLRGILARALWIHRRTGFGRMDWLHNLPDMTDEISLIKMDVMMRLTSVSYLLGKMQFVNIILRMLQLSIKEGRAPATAFSIATYGLLAIGLFGREERGYELGVEAVNMADAFGSDEVIAKTRFTMGFFLSNWLRHPKDSFTYLQSAQSHAMYAGDNVYYAYAVAAELLGYILSNQPLDLVRERIREEDSKIRTMEVTDIILLYDVIERYVDVANGTKWTPEQEDALREKLQQTSMASIPAVDALLRLRHALIMKDDMDVESELTTACKRGKELIGMILSEDVLYFGALYALDTLGATGVFNRNVIKAYKRLKKLSKINPTYFGHRFELLQAERNRVTGNYRRSVKHYAQSVELAERNGMILEQALACERYGNALIEKGQGRFAETMLKEAFSLYTEYGLYDKCRDMIAAYPHIYFGMSESMGSTTSPRSGLTDRTIATSIVKAARAITEQVEPEELLRQFIQVIVQFSGARMVLLVVDEGGGRLVAEYGSDQQVRILDEIEHDKRYPDMLYRSARRTRESMDSAAVEGHPYLLSDPYFTGRIPSNLLALPILHNQQFFGMLYLESDMKATRFDDQTKDALEALCAQFVLSYNNAGLYEKLSRSEMALQEHRVRLEQLISERTTELFNAHKDIRTLLDNVSQGFLTLDDRLTIEPVISKESRRIFGKHVGGDAFVSVLSSYATQEQTALLQDTLGRIFSEEDPVRRDAYMRILPGRMVIGASTIAFDYRFIAAQDRNRLLVIMNDVTEERELLKKQEINQRMIEMLGNLIRNREELSVTLESYYTFAKGIADWHDPVSKMRELHKYKGIFQQFGLRGAANRIHELESLLQQESAAEIDEHMLLDAVERDFRSAAQYSGIDFKRWTEQMEISREGLGNLERMLKQQDSSPEVMEALEALRYNPMIKMMIPFQKSVEQLAKKREKKVRLTWDIPENLWVNREQIQPLADAMGHLIRNAVEHGIELPVDREQAGKPETGEVSCTVRARDGRVVIELLDDGAGLNMSKLRAIAEQKGIQETVAVEALIFAPEVTTTETVDVESGRGYGLAMIQHEVEQLGGTIKVTSQAGIETQFRVTVPLEAGFRIHA